MRRLNVPLIAVMAVALPSLAANAGGPLVDIRSVDPTIIVELRYAGRNNLVGYPLYPRGTMRSRSSRSRFGFGHSAGVSAALPIWAENLGCVPARGRAGKALARVTQQRLRCQS